MVPRLTNLNKFVRKTRAQKDRIKQGAANYVRANVRAMLRELVLNTPQWSGDLAASWRIDLNYKPADQFASKFATDDWEDLIGQASFKGDQDAWMEALKINQSWLDAIKYNAKVSIVNVKPIALTYATAPESSEEIQRLRPGNYIPGDVMAIAYVSQKFKLNSNITGLTLKSQLNYDT